MANIVQAVLSDSFRAKLAEIYSNTTPWAAIDSFKIGCGGWASTPSGHQPVVPDKVLVDLTAGTGIYTGSYAYVFTKNSFTSIAFIAPQQVQVVCTVDVGEANDDGFGNPPEFFELGIFDADGVMLAYSTFPMEVKTADKSLEHVVIIDF